MNVALLRVGIFYFHCYSQEFWAGLAGRAGYVKIRDGTPVDELTLYMNLHE